MDLKWYYFGDTVCLTTGRSGDFVQKLVDDDDGPGASVTGKLLPGKGNVEVRLKALFKPINQGHATPEAPLLQWIRKAVKAAKKRKGFPWQTGPIKDIDVRIVQHMPIGREREFLLTPTRLCVPWALFANAKRKGKRLGLHLRSKGLGVPTLTEAAPNYESGHHMWVDAALDAGDVLGRVRHAHTFNPIHALEVMAAERAREDRPDIGPVGLPDEVRAAWSTCVPDVTPLSLGSFDMTIEPKRPRHESHVMSDGTKITFVLGLEDPEPVEGIVPDKVLYCPWPCGALDGCSP